MALQFWFGITWTYSCPHCNHANVEKAGINSTTNDKAKLEVEINKQVIRCQKCKRTPKDGTRILVDVQPGTYEELKTKGYPVPPTPQVQ